MEADSRGGLITRTHLTDVKVPAQTSAFQQTFCQEKLYLKETCSTHTGPQVTRAVENRLFSRGYFLVWLGFFDGTIELLLIPQLSGARLSLQIDGLLESAFTHAHKHTHTHTRAH